MKALLLLSMAALAFSNDSASLREKLLSDEDNEIDNIPLEHKIVNQTLTNDNIKVVNPPFPNSLRKVRNIRVPDSFCVTIKAYYNQPFKTFIENSQELRKRGLNDPKLVIKRIFTVGNNIYKYPGLDKKITLRLIGEPTYVNDRDAHRWEADSESFLWLKHSSIKNRLDLSADHFAFFTHTNVYHGTVGVAYMGTVCRGAGLRSSITEFTNTIATTADTFAHEVGHALGMDHAWEKRDSYSYQCGGRNGVMDYSRSDKWTRCSKNDFIIHWKGVGRRSCLSASRCSNSSPGPSDCSDSDSPYCSYRKSYCKYYLVRTNCPKLCNIC